MALYYYDKYSTKDEYKQILLKQWLWTGYGGPYGGKKEYVFNFITGAFTLAGATAYTGRVDEGYPVGSYAYSLYTGGELTRHTTRSDGMWIEQWTANQIKVKDTFLEKISAENGNYPINGLHGDGFWYVRGDKVNTAPTVNLTSPSNNQTLYENDILSIAGNARDEDANQSVTAYYQINSETRRVLATDVSQKNISLLKQLTFKGGKFYDGQTAVTGALTDGVPHKLKVWAVDDQGGQSAIIERAFYVVPNRAPLLSVDTITPNGIINTDKFTISGNASDQDANSNVTVTRRINGGNAIEIYNGPGGAWAFDVSLAQLVVGENTIIIEVIDNYGAKTSKTIKLNKNEVKTPILDSVARYKIEPPKGSAKGVLLWIQRDEDLNDLTVELSMTLQGEQESYVTLTPTNTAPVDSETVEDEFYFEADEAKNNIILKLSTSRPDININHKIHLISGVLE